MTALSLPTPTIKALRADAHHLDPVVMIGAEGLSPAVLKEIEAALNAHGLIKVRASSDERAQRAQWLQAISEQLSAAAVQHIGKLLVLWRPMPEKVQEAREDRRPGPKVMKVVKNSSRGGQRPEVKRVQVLGNQRLTAGGKIKRARTGTKSVKKASAR
jgi:putative YhbY family RNA-binding protein